MRIITHSNYRATSTPLFSQLKVIKLCDRYRYSIGLYMYKVKNNLLPFSCRHHIKTLNIMHRFQLREISDFEILHFRTKVRSKCVGVVGPQIWPTLPTFADFVKSLDTEFSFKKGLLTFLLGQYLPD